MKEHPDKVVKEMIDVAKKHGYGVEAVRLSWLSGIPNSEVMRIEYGVKDDSTTNHNGSLDSRSAIR